MKPGYLRRIALTLVAAQLLCAPPMASAFAAMASMSADEAHCADLMPAGVSSDGCPCCPEEGMSTAACLSNCLASVGPVPSVVLPQARVAATRVASPPVLHLASPADPPLKPPPIA